MPLALKDLGENAVLERILATLCPAAPMLVGPGDDCAVVARDAAWDSLLKTDVVVEGIHFTPDTAPERIGRKALARAVSDIAAMGGIPEHALITLLVHPKRPIATIDAIYKGICALAAQFGISIAGGETAALPYDGLIINVALTGRVEAGTAILRSGGSPGDLIYVSGPLGGSFPSEHHLDFTPRIELARAILNAGMRPSAMMDLSDGVAADLPKLAAASRCGFEITPHLVPCNPGCSIEQALNDGEDYELLLTLPAEQSHLLSASNIKLFPIGVLTQSPQNHPSGGWQHFSH